MTLLFVTGTDTGVGKTRVAAGLLAIAAGRGSTRGIKAVETGCLPVSGAAIAESRATTSAPRSPDLGPPLARQPDLNLVAADAELLARAAGHEPLCPFRFAPPVAPSVVAGPAGLDLGAIVAFVRDRPADFVAVEGAGGLLVPLGPDSDMADLAAALGSRCHILIVAADRLGTINHTLLTLAAARARGLTVAGVVLNDCDGTRDPQQENHRVLLERAGCPVATLAHRPGLEDFVRLWAALELGPSAARG